MSQASNKRENTLPKDKKIKIKAEGAGQYKMLKNIKYNKNSMYKMIKECK